MEPSLRQISYFAGVQYTLATDRGMAVPLHPAGKAQLSGRYVTLASIPAAGATHPRPLSEILADQAAGGEGVAAAAVARAASLGGSAAYETPGERLLWLKLVGQSTALGPVQLGEGGIFQAGVVSHYQLLEFMDAPYTVTLITISLGYGGLTWRR